MSLGAAVPSQMMSGFIQNLRKNGFPVGPAETIDALAFLESNSQPDFNLDRAGLKIMLSGNKANWDRFDDLFDAYWFGRGVRTAIRMKTIGDSSRRNIQNPNDIIKKIVSGSSQTEKGGHLHHLGSEEGNSNVQGKGHLIASSYEILKKVDFKDLVSQEDVRKFEDLAMQLARAMKYRLSRRRIPSIRGYQINLRRTIRRNISKGGDLIDLVFQKRPNRPVNLVVLLDVSGSMSQYSKLFLAFLRGLMGQWLKTDVFLFHTRLVRISDALGDLDHTRAMDRLTLKAEGFGGGTKIGESLRIFNENYSKEIINSRSVVFIISDGYDTGNYDIIENQLVRLKKRARRLIWLNPLAGWDSYEPVAQGMRQALPHIDLFLPANTLESLANLETHLARI